MPTTEERAFVKPPELPELDAGFLKWYSKYFGTKVPKPTTPNNMNIVERALNTYTLFLASLFPHSNVSLTKFSPLFGKSAFSLSIFFWSVDSELGSWGGKSARKGAKNAVAADMIRNPSHQAPRKPGSPSVRPSL